MITVVRVVSFDNGGVLVRALRGVSFHGPVDAEEEQCPWEEIEAGDWRRLG